MQANPLHIALDATYSIGDTLSGVGLYSREILTGLAAAHPRARFDFCYRPHRYLRALGLERPPNARPLRPASGFWWLHIGRGVALHEADATNARY